MQTAPTPRVVTLASEAKGAVEPAPVALNSTEFDDVWCALLRAAEKDAKDAVHHKGEGHAITARTFETRAKRQLDLAERLNAARFGRG